MYTNNNALTYTLTGIRDSTADGQATFQPSIAYLKNVITECDISNLAFTITNITEVFRITKAMLILA